MGFQPGQHFLAIDHTTDLAALVAEIVAQPERIYSMRQSGQQLVWQRHTEPARELEVRPLACGVLELVGLAATSPNDLQQEAFFP